MIELSGASTSLDEALAVYHAAWHDHVATKTLKDWAASAHPVTISWKVADKDTLCANLRSLDDSAEQIHIGTVNGRFIASAVLREPADMNISIIKILERRAGSDDSLGLDSIDFLVDDIDATFKALQTAGCRVEKEHNDMHEWASLRFGSDEQFEAKFTNNLVLAVAIKELEASIATVMANLKLE